MGNDDITLVSTTDSAEQVQAALTGKPAAEPPPDEKAAAAPAPETPPVEPPPAEPAPTEETPEQKEARETKEASEAGSRLAKRKQSIQQEIDELTRSKHTVRRDVEAEESRLAELRRQRTELEAATAKPPEPKPEDKKPDEGRAEPQLDAVDEKGDAKYATYEDYLSDHAKWTKEEAEQAAKRVVEQERNAERARIERDSVNRVVNERLAAYQANLEEFKKTHADFDAVFEDAKAEVQEALAAIGGDALRIVDAYTVFDAEDGPALTYHLLKHPDELKAIAQKQPQQQLIHLARLDQSLRGQGAPPARPSAAAETKAPQPIKPVGAGPTATTVPLDEEPYQDYKLRRERELKARRSA
jgi:hypothetical protein